MPAAFKRCVRKVAKQKGTRNAYAICTAANAGHVKEYRRKERSSKRSKKRRA